MPKNNFLDLTYQEAKLKKAIKAFEPWMQSKILAAWEMAKNDHWGQLRHSGEPYIIHPIRASLILIEELGIKETDMICAMLLHDVCEDGDTTIKEIVDAFGLEIGDLVEGLTRTRPENETEEEKKHSKLKYIERLSRGVKEIIILKLCDVLDNARSWEYIPQNNLNIQKISRWKNELSEYLAIAQANHPQLFEMLRQYI